MPARDQRPHARAMVQHRDHRVLPVAAMRAWCAASTISMAIAGIVAAATAVHVQQGSVTITDQYTDHHVALVLAQAVPGVVHTEVVHSTSQRT